jgi:aryl-alcohol dehydrogenase-like predicted oxidoreductase
MRYRHLGRSGLLISEICLGTMTFGRETNESAAAAMLDASLDAGVNLIDTANAYAGGQSEQLLGKLLGERRHRVILSSKVASRLGPDRNDGGLSRRHIITACEDSLRRLRTDHLDLYFLHYVDPSVDPVIPLQALDALIRAGKVRYAGASNFAAWQYMHALGLSDRNQLEPIRVIQPMYSLLKRQAEVEILPMARQQQLGVISYSPMAAGILSGKYQARHQAATGARMTWDPKYQSRYGDEHQYQVGQSFAALAQAHDWPAPALSVAWARRHPAVSGVIVGARDFDQLAPVLEQADRVLPESLARLIEDLVPPPPMATDRDEERANPGEPSATVSA